MQPVKWGILSTALIGVEKVIPAMKKGKLTEVTAIASRNLDKAKQWAEKLGIPKAYGSYEELLQDSEIEAVYNPLPNHMHVPWSVKAAEAGKNVLCEKPIALDAAEAQKLVEARDRTGVLIQEAFMVRYHPQWRRARDLVREGRIGDVRAIQGFFSYYNDDPGNIRNKADIGGGALYDIGCYPILTSRFILGAEPTRVVGLLERDPVMKTDRLTGALLEFPGNRQLGFICSTQLVAYQRMQIYGIKGRIEIQIPFNAPLDEPCKMFLDDGSELGDVSATGETFNADQYTLQGDAFSEHIRNGKPLEFPLEDAVRNMRILDAIFRSAKNGGWENV